jgi:hypothetical protein
MVQDLSHHSHERAYKKAKSSRKKFGCVLLVQDRDAHACRAAVQALAHVVLSVESTGLIESLMDLLSTGDATVVSEVCFFTLAMILELVATHQHGTRWKWTYNQWYTPILDHEITGMPRNAITCVSDHKTQATECQLRYLGKKNMLRPNSCCFTRCW